MEVESMKDRYKSSKGLTVVLCVQVGTVSGIHAVFTSGDAVSYASYCLIALFVCVRKLEFVSKQVCLDSLLSHTLVVQFLFFESYLLSSFLVCFLFLVFIVTISLRLCPLSVGRHQKALL